MPAAVATSDVVVDVAPPDARCQKQTDRDSCGYYALANAVNDLRGNNLIDAQTLKGKDGGRVNKLEFNAVLKGGGLSNDCHVVIPYQATDEAQKPDLINAALQGRDSTFIGHDRATITTTDTSGASSTETDYHYAMRKKSDAKPTYPEFQAFKVKCWAAGKQVDTMPGMGMRYEFRTKIQAFSLSLVDVLAVRQGPDPAARPDPIAPKSFLTWLKGKICCCCCCRAQKDD